RGTCSTCRGGLRTAGRLRRRPSAISVWPQPASRRAAARWPSWRGTTRRARGWRRTTSPARAASSIAPPPTPTRARSTWPSTARPVLVIDTLVTKSLLEARMALPNDARATAAEAERVAQQVPDATVRARMLADVAVASGAALEETDPQRAVDALNRAIDYYGA